MFEVEREAGTDTRARMRQLQQTRSNYIYNLYEWVIQLYEAKLQKKNWVFGVSEDTDLEFTLIYILSSQ